MPNQFSRTQLLLGSDSMAILHNSRVAVFGIGGVQRGTGPADRGYCGTDKGIDEGSHQQQLHNAGIQEQRHLIA